MEEMSCSVSRNDFKENDVGKVSWGDEVKSCHLLSFARWNLLQSFRFDLHFDGFIQFQFRFTFQVRVEVHEISVEISWSIGSSIWWTIHLTSHIHFRNTQLPTFSYFS